MVNSEIEYISKKINEFPDDKKRYELYISDSNFGMFKEDFTELGIESIFERK